MLSHVWLFVTPWTITCQAPLSMGFSRQEYWSRVPFPTLGDLPDQGLNLCPALQVVLYLWAIGEARQDPELSLMLLGEIFRGHWEWVALCCMCIICTMQADCRSFKTCPHMIWHLVSRGAVCFLSFHLGGPLWSLGKQNTVEVTLGDFQG